MGKAVICCLCDVALDSVAKRIRLLKQWQFSDGEWMCPECVWANHEGRGTTDD